jgi:putative tricarboxylic transport membrane protein
VKLKSPKDFWAGAMFLAFGLFFALWAMARYRIGSSVRMGPGYFPAVLGALLALLGAVLVAGSLAIDGPRLPRFNLRPLLLVLASCVAYGYLMQPLGLVLATAALVVISALGGHEFKWKEVAALSAILVLFSVLVFVQGLALPFPLWPAAFG